MSDWPLSLLLDELWLRSRRLAVHGLERSVFWAGGDQHWTEVRELMALGRDIDRRCFHPAFSAAEYAWLRSEQAFATPRAAFARRGPLILAFGHQVTSLFAACFGKERDSSTAADAGACFNLGISLIDLVLDERQFKPTAETVVALLAEHGVRRLLEPGAWLAFDEQLVRIPLGDTRVLLRIVSRVYKGIAQLGLTLDGKEELASLLDDAFKAEIASARHAVPAHRRRAKSILPFQIMACIARAGATADEHAALAHRELADHIGNAFALLDDLCDLVDDLRSSAINSIVDVPFPDEREEKSRSIDNGEESAIVRALLEQHEIEQSVAALIRHLQQAEVLALSLTCPSRLGMTTKLLGTTRTFIRNWLE